MKFTGIWFTNYSKETVEKTGNKTIQKHRLSGNCYSLPFQMEFQLLEIQPGVQVNCQDYSNESISAAVTDLSIIMECGEYSDLSKFVSSAEERGNLLLFFRSLSSFAEWCEHRKCTFKHFKFTGWSFAGSESVCTGKGDLSENRLLPLLQKLEGVYLFWVLGW
nr:centromere protein P isoform X4 [Chrysemys picta bellii]